MINVNFLCILLCDGNIKNRHVFIHEYTIDTLIYYMIIDYYEITNNSFVHAAVGMTMLFNKRLRYRLNRIYIYNCIYTKYLQFFFCVFTLDLRYK